MALLRKVADPGDGEGRLWAQMRVHVVRNAIMTELGASSKLNAEWSFFSFLRDEGRKAAQAFLDAHAMDLGQTLDARHRRPARRGVSMGLVGILVALGLLIWLAYRGWSILLLAPAAAILAAALAGEPLLAHWTQTFMASAAQFVMQFFPIFLLGALFGKLMEDSGSVTSIAKYMTERLGPQRAVLAVVLAGAIVTYGGVSLFVAFFVIAPMAHAIVSRGGDSEAPHAGGDRARHDDLHHVGAARNARDSERDPDAVLRHHALRRAGAWDHRRDRDVRLRHVVARAGRAKRARQGRGLWGGRAATTNAAEDLVVRERATTASTFDPPEAIHGRPSDVGPPIALAALPLVIVVAVNLLMSLFVLPRMDASFLAKAEWGETSLAAVGGVWAVVTALFVAIVVLIASTIGACRLCATAWMRAPTPRCCRCSASRAWSASARSSPRCLRLRWCATGCSASKAARWCRWRSPPMCWPR